MRKGLFFILCMTMLILAACSPVTDSGNQPDISTKLLIKSEEIESVLLVSTDTLKIERTGSQTIIHDIAGNRIYTLIIRKIARKKTAPKPSSNVLIDTDTLTVEQLRGVLLVTEKSTNTNHLI